MKVVQINAVCNYGSTGRTVLELSKYLTNNNIENYVFYGNGHSDYPLAKRLNTDFGLKVHALLSRLTGKQGYFSFLHTKRIIKELKKIKPDIVHLRNLHGNFIHLNMLLKYLGKNDVATVVSLHDCWFYTGHCTTILLKIAKGGKPAVIIARAEKMIIPVGFSTKVKQYGKTE